MPHVKCLQCRECKTEYPIEPLNACEFCFGPLEVAYDYNSVAKAVSRKSIESGPNTMWRYHDFLPVEKESAVDISTGFTPLIHAKNLGRQLGLDHLYIKNDSVNPTFSFKDRPVSVTATKALEFEFDVLACVSTGNLMGSVAAHGAKAGMETMVFYPADLEQGKIQGAAVYGPTMVAVEGTYDQANRFCSELADTYRWAFVNINMRAYYAEGSKTLTMEVVEQLGWKAPQNFVVPMAGGSLICKVDKALRELHQIGLLDSIPTSRIHGAQASGCSPITTAVKNGTDTIRPVRKPDTIAKSLAIGDPADGFFAQQVIRNSGGWAEDASDEDIVEGIQLLAETEGIFTETAGGVTVSVARKLLEQGRINRDESLVLCITGNGLKTQDCLTDAVNQAEVIPPSLEAFESLVETKELAATV